MIDRLQFALAALKELDKGVFDLRQFCFKEQLEFIEDPAQFKTAVCSRRSGKTIACAADLIDTALKTPEIVCLYITLSRVNAKRIIWPELLKLNRLFMLNGHSNETDLSLKFPNGSVIYVSGAKDKSEIENFRGLPLKKVYIDECQSFRSYIQDLVDDVLSKALFDYAGTLCLIGTPALVPAGYFHDCAHARSWAHHGWTMFDNPHLAKKSGKTPEALIQADCERMGVGLEHPKIQRECFGRWVVDSDSLVFHYDGTRNHFPHLPHLDTFVLGVDLGFDDADAIAVIGWSEKGKEAYLVEEVVKNKQGISELAAQIGALIQKYKPIRVVMDTGGLGKKIAEELAQRYQLPIDAAEKSRKFEYIELLNDAMRTSRFFADKGSRFAQDCGLVEWDRDTLSPDKLKISDSYHSDICDAVLYAFREALHWLYEPEAVKPAYSTPAWQKQQEEEMLEAAEEELRRQKSDEFWSDPWSSLN